MGCGIGDVVGGVLVTLWAVVLVTLLEVLLVTLSAVVLDMLLEGYW